MAGAGRRARRAYLAGDIGGTKTVLALFEGSPGSLELVVERRYESRRHASFTAILSDFLAAGQSRPEAICLGVAGPVRDGRCHTTNLPWLLDASEIAAAASVPRVELVNDLVAMALGVLRLDASDLDTIQAGRAGGPDNVAVIAAGTGLGEAILVWDGRAHHPLASEGGHCDFAPRDDLQMELLRHLRQAFGHVSYERVLSGPGLCAIHDFLRGRRGCAAAQPRAGSDTERAPRIVERGIREGDRECRQAVEIFVDIFGAEAANLALKCLARGGVYLAGGIAPALFPALRDTFTAAFADKGRFADLMREIPVRVVRNPLTPLLGAAYRAAHRA